MSGAKNKGWLGNLMIIIHIFRPHHKGIFLEKKKEVHLKFQDSWYKSYRSHSTHTSRKQYHAQLLQNWGHKELSSLFRRNLCQQNMQIILGQMGKPKKIFAVYRLQMTQTFQTGLVTGKLEKWVFSAPCAFDPDQNTILGKLNFLKKFINNDNQNHYM